MALARAAEFSLLLAPRAGGEEEADLESSASRSFRMRASSADSTEKRTRPSLRRTSSYEAAWRRCCYDRRRERRGRGGERWREGEKEGEVRGGER